MSRCLGIALVAAMALAALPAAAQDESRPRPGEVRRDEAFKLVDAYIMSNLQEGLGLSDDQFVKALPLVKKLQTERRDYVLARTVQMRELRRLLRTGNASEVEVIDRLKELKAIESDGPARTKKDMDALDAVLSPVQQAKYRLLEIDVEQRLRELMNRARPAAPTGRGPRP